MITEFDVTIFWVDKRHKIEYKTLREYTFEVDGLTITIPKGYQTDFASVPRIFWPVLPPVGKHNPAALVHDYLYDNKIGTRKQADYIFFQLMIQYQVNIVAAFAMYLGVRLGGYRWWKN